MHIGFKMPRIKLDSVSVDLPVFNSQNRSLKKKVITIATGGRIAREANGNQYVRALDNLNFSIRPNERVGLLGHNGAGKSTLLRVLSKVYTPTSGKAIIEGNIGSLINISLGIDREATGLENIFLRAALLGIEKSVVERELDNIIEFSELGDCSRCCR